MFVLVGLEIRTLYLDRDVHDMEQASARCMQLESFKQIATTLSTAISGIDSNLKTTNALLTTAESTLKNTLPRAHIVLTGIVSVEEGRGISIALFPPDKDVEVSYWMRNTGTSPAYKFHRLLRIYAGKLGDRGAQADLQRRFDDDWRKLEESRFREPLNNSGELELATSVQHLTADDIREITSGAKTLYAVFRAQYSDPSGDWRTDDCEAYQDPINNGAGIAQHCFDRPMTARMPHRGRLENAISR